MVQKYASAVGNRRLLGELHCLIDPPLAIDKVIAPEPVNILRCAARLIDFSDRILAVAASMLTAAFHMLRDGTEYNDLSSEHFDRQTKAKTIRRLLKRLQDLGCDVPELAHAA